MKNQIRAPKAKKLNSYHIKNPKYSDVSIDMKISSQKRKTFPYEHFNNKLFLQGVESEFQENAEKLDVIDEVLQIISTSNSSEYLGVPRCENTSFEKNFANDKNAELKKSEKSSSNLSNYFEEKISKRKKSFIQRKRGNAKYLKTKEKVNKAKISATNRSSILVTSSIKSILKAFRNYTDNTDSDWKAINSSQIALLNKKSKYFSFKQNDASKCGFKLDCSDVLNESLIISSKY